MSFYDEWAKLDWGEQQAWVLTQTDADVERALARLARTGKRELADFARITALQGCKAIRVAATRHLSGFACRKLQRKRR